MEQLSKIVHYIRKQKEITRTPFVFTIFFFLKNCEKLQFVHVSNKGSLPAIYKHPQHPG